MSKPGIPRYGKDFEHKDLPYIPGRAGRAYVLKRDPAWFIWSDSTSKQWQVYWKVPGTGASFETATAMGTPLGTFGLAMIRLLAGIELGYYQVAG